MPPIPFARRALVEELEPRLLFSADFAPALADALAPQTEQRMLDASGEYAGSNHSQQSAQHARLEVVFIDLRVQDYEKILADIQTQNTDGHSIEVVLIDPERDGIAQIGEFLSQRQDVDAVHLISHGSAGSVQLGAGELNFDSLLANAAPIKQWGNALSAEADILIYGCDLASTEAGQSLVDALSKLTGADVAASDDLTGAAELGGDWVLEYRTGDIESALAVDAHTQQAWANVLNAAPTLDSTKSPALTAQNEDAGAPAGAVGTLVSSLVDFASPAGQIDNVTDPDSGALLGIAVTAANTTNGSWWYSTNNGGAWNVLGAVSESNARLLAADASTRLYFQPNANYNGTFANAITFRAWDQTSGSNGGTANTSVNGGASAFSTATDTASLTVSAVNDPPIAANDTQSVSEGGILSVSAPGVLGNDTDIDSVAGSPAPGATLSYVAANDGDGVWNNQTATTGYDWTLTNFGTQVTHTASPGSAYTGITAAYRFSGTSSGGWVPTLQNIVGDPTNNSASFEVWFRTDTLTGQHIIFETGGSSSGASLYLDGSFLKFATRTGGAAADEISVDLAGLYASPTSEFIQLVAVIDQTSTQMKLYLDGVLRASGSFTGANGTDWTGNDGAGLGMAYQDVNPSPAAGSGNLDGDIAIVRFYERALTGAEAAANFSAIASAPLTVTAVQGNAANVGNPVSLPSGALLTMNGNGSYTYNPNSAFEYLAMGQTTTDSFAYAVSDSGGQSSSATVTITITGQNDAPLLYSVASPTLLAQNEDANAPIGVVGTLVSSLVDFANPAGQLDNVADPDSGALTGIAITAADTTNGVWHYSTNNGASWNALGAVANNNARLLAADVNTRLYFQPNANYNGTLTNAITFRAWDQTSGSNGALADTSSNGGTTAFSTATDTASLTVNPVNDAPTFGTGDGMITTAIGTGADIAYDVTVQPDGKILLAGSARVGTTDDFALTRYNADGSLDLGFGTNGIVTTAIGAGADWAHGVVVQTDGKIVVAGRAHNGSNYDLAVVRYNADGTLDTSFGGGTGKVTVAIGTGDDVGNMVVLQSDGKIIVSARARVGTTDDFAVVRLNTDGTLDAGFGTGGMVTTAIGTGHETGQRLTLQTDGKIVVAGRSFNGSNYDFAVVRYNTNGSLDTSFGGSGKVTTAIGAGDDYGSGVAVQADGKILVGGFARGGATDDFAVVRYLSDGTLDAGFGIGGKITTSLGAGNDQGHGLSLQADGKILVGGTGLVGATSDFALMRYLPDGSLDTGFGNAGIVTAAVGTGNDAGLEMTVQADGKILLAGSSFNGSNTDFALVRVNSDGSLDSGFDTAILNGNPTFTEGGAPVVLDSDVRVFDTELSAADNFNGATLTLARNGGANAQDLFSATGTLSALTQGSALMVGGTTIGVVTTNNAGTLMLSFNANATQARVNQTLQSIAYANSSDTPPASARIDWTFSDGNAGAQGSGGALTATGSTTVRITAVNDSPAGADKTVVATEDTVYTFALADFGFTDTDGHSLLAVKIATLPAAGSLALNGVAVTAGQFVSAADIGSGLLRFTPATNANGAGYASFTFQVQDNGGTTNGGVNLDPTPNTITVNVSAVNDAPVNIVPGTQTTSQNTTLVFSAADGNAISIADIDAGAGALQITLSATNGALTLAGTAGLSFTSGDGTADATMNFTGTVANINAALNGLSFTPTAGFTGSTTLQIVTNDQGNTGSGGTLSDTDVVNLSITSQALWFSTSNNGSSGGLSWNAGQGVQLGDPGLVLEPGISGGTFTSAFNLQAFAAGVNVDGLEYVSRAITIGSGGNTLTLQAGDVLLSLVGSATLTSMNTLTVSNDEVFLFRPTVAGNYSSGSFTLVLDNFAAIHGGTDTGDFALVEQNTLVGDITLNAGSFLFTTPGAGVGGDILRFTPTGVGTGTTSGSVATLANDSDAGLGIGNRLVSLELVETTMALGNVTLSAGTIIGGVDANDTVGANNLSVSNRDLFTLTFTQTTLGSGSAVANATLLLQGNEAGLDTPSESLDAIALVARSSAAPVLTLPGSTLNYTENAAATVIDATATVTDADSANFAGGTLFVNFSANGSANDRLTIRNQGTGAGQIGVSGSNVTYGGVTIGSFAGGTDGSTPLTVSLNANATVAATQALLRNVTFQNISEAPSTLARTVSVVLTDGSGGTSNIATKTINITSVNDAPAGSNGTITATEDTTYTFTLSDFGFTDADGHALMRVYFDTLPATGTLRWNNTAFAAGNWVAASDIASGLLTYVPTTNANGTAVASFTFRVQDDGGTANGGVDTDTTPNTITINITALNDAPVAADDRLAADFDGLDDFVSIPSSAALTMGSTMTMEAWINPDISANTRQIILNKEGEYELGLFDDGSLNFAIAEGGVWDWHGTGATIARNTWTHVAVTYSAGAVTAYVNGVAVHAETLATSSIDDVYPAMNDLRIGGRMNNPAGQYFDGRIAEVRVWNVARSGAEIASAMNAPLAGGEAGLAGYWALDEGSGGSAADRTANANHGSLVNGTAWAGYRLAEDSTLNVGTPGVLRNDFDADGEALQAILVTGPAHGSLTLNPDGAFSYTPDAHWNGTDTFTYKLNDGTADSNVATVKLVVDPVNDEQAVTTNTGTTIAENATGTVITSAMLATNDVDNTPAQLVYTLTGAPANGTLRLNGVALGAGGTFTQADINAGLLTYDHNGSESSADSLAFIVDDGVGVTSSGTFNLSVTPVNDNAPVITSDGGSATTTLSVAENTVAVTSVTATDADLPAQTLTYSIIGGADAALFTIDANTGGLSFIAAPNREVAGDVGGNHVYDVTVQVSDGSLTDTQQIAITVTDVDEFDVGTVIDADSSTNLVAENAVTGTAVGITAFASDADATNNAITYSLDNDAGGRFAVDSNTGVVTVASTLDYETNASHAITVRASSADGSFAIQSFTIVVTDVSEAGIGALSDINVAANTVAENSAVGTAVGVTAFADDPDGTDTVSYSLDDDAGGRFAIDANTGVVTVAGAIDREAAGVYSITVRATSTDTSTTTQAFGITIGDVDEYDVSPVIDTDAATNAVDENAGVGSFVGITAFASDADATTNGITYSLTDNDGGRFAIDSATGVVTVAGVIDREADGATRNIAVRATSADGSFDEQVFSISINDVDEFDVTPVVDTDATINQVSENAANGSVVGITALASDADATSNSITYSLDDNAGGRFSIHATSGVVTVADGSLLDYEAATSHAITLRASSSDGSYSTRVLTINVAPVNDHAPVITSDGGGATTTLNVAENTTAVTTVTAFDADLPAQTLTYAIVGGVDAGLFSIDGNSGVLSFNVPPDFETPADAGLDNVYEVIVRVFDGAFSDSQTLSVTVTPVNDNAPVSTPVILVPIAEDSGARLITQAELLAGASDADGDSLTATGLTISSGSGTLADNGDGTWTYTPAANDDTSAGFSYTVTDGGQTTPGSATLDIAPVNDAPVASHDTASGGEDSTLAGNVLGNDGDVDSASLTAVLVSGPAHGALVLNADGSFTYTPDADWHGGDSFTYKAHDGALDSSVATVSITVNPANDAPAVQPVSLGRINEDGSLLITQAMLLAGANDVDGDSLAAISLALASGSGTLVDNGDGSWTFAPDADWNGAASFSFAVDDGSATTPNTASLDVDPANDAPILAAIGNQAVGEGQLLSFTASASDIDVPANTLTYSLAGAPAGATIDANTGAFAWTPTEAQGPGVYTFDVIVSDGVATDSETISVAVHELNAAPAGTDKIITTNEDTAYIFTAVDFGFTDPGDAPANNLLAVRIAALPAAGSLTLNGVAVTAGQNISVVDINSGLLRFTPAADAFGTGYASFTFQVRDDGGTANGGVDLDPTPDTITLDVTAVNDAPTTTPVALSGIAEDSGPRLITQAQLLANAADVDGPGLSAVGLSISSGSGTLADNGDGTWTYTPAADDDTAAGFDYTIVDGSGGSTAGSASLDIAPVNDAPTASDASLSTNEDTPHGGTLPAFHDIDSAVVTYALASGAAHGTTFVNGDGSFGYAPDSHYHGADSFTYTVSDGAGGSTTYRVTITVDPVNDAPSVLPVDLGSLNEDGSLVITQAMLLAGANDVDGDSLAAINLTLSSGSGTLTDNGNGSWTFTPATNWNGGASFGFAVDDGTTTTPNTASLIVDPVNDAPSVLPVDLGSLNEDGSLVITQAMLLAGASDADGNALAAINLVLATGSGTLTDNGNGSWTFTPATNWNGGASFGFAVDDGTTTTPNTASLIVDPVNDAPTLVANTLNVVEGGTVVLGTANLNTSDVEQAAPALTYTVSNVLHGQFEWTTAPGTAILGFTQADIDAGLVAFVHDAGEFAPSYEVSVSDGSATTGPQAATILFTQVAEGIHVSAASASATTEAGGTVSFDVTLNSQPFADVTVFIVSGSPAEGTASVSSLTFTAANWNVAQQVTVTGVDDFIDDGDQGYTIQLQPAVSADRNYDALDAGDVALSNLDDDTAGVLVTPAGGLVTDEAGRSDTFSVVLTSQPLADVVIQLDTSNPGEGVLSTNALTFTASDWNIPRVVTVTGVNDTLNDGGVAYQVIAAPALSADSLYNGIGAGAVDIVNLSAADPVPINPPTPGFGPVPEPGITPPEPLPEPTMPAQPGRGEAGPAVVASGISGTPLPDVDFSRAEQAANAYNTRLKPGVLPIYDEPAHRYVLSDARADGNILLRLLEFIQASYAMADSDDNAISPAVRVEISKDQNFRVEILSQGAQIAAVSLSVGAVWWALRAGGLFASLLTSLPAWRSFDVLPVLSREADDDEDDAWGLGDEAAGNASAAGTAKASLT